MSIRESTRTTAARRSKRWRVGLVALTIGVLAVGGITRLPARAFKVLASRSLAERDTPRAATWLGWARRFDSGDPEIEFLLARAARQRGEMDESRELLERAWKGGYSVARLEREQILAMAQSGQMRDAESALPDLLMNPQGDEAEICEAFATGFFKNHRLGESLELLNARLRDQPKDLRAWLLHAKINIEFQLWTNAGDDLQNLLKARPAHGEAAYLMGFVLLKQREPDMAILWLSRAERDPQFQVRAGVRRIEALRMSGRFDAAREVARGLLEVQPEDGSVLLEAGRLESDRGEYGLAIDRLERALVISPQSAEVHFALAVALRASHRSEEAKSHFRFAALARERLMHAQELEAVVAKEPADAAVRCEIGTILVDYGQTERGLAWLQSALDYDPENAAAHQRLAEYYESRSHDSAEFAALARKHRSSISVHPVRE